ncbi:putative C6 transcription factor [Aspergillus stella-maris]|uniref:putative C6 transcription factor n=1 Tax=Aspergillus stella-maris TaxID=1810926 RepID=UPI003CCE18CF
MEDDHAQSSAPRRRRPALSCTICRRRKLKCDRSLPCGQCIKSKTPDLCVFSAPHSAHNIAPRSAAPSSPSDHRNAPSDGASSAGNGFYMFDSKNRVVKPRSRPDELHELRSRVQTLEHALARGSSVQPPDISDYDCLPEFGLRTAQDAISDQVQNLSERACFRGKNGKTRYRGRSSAELTFTFLNDVMAFLQGRKKDLKAEGSDFQNLRKFRCDLKSTEKKNQDQVRQGTPSSLKEMLPPRNIADEFLNLYLSTFETTYRILHVPSFLKEYEAHWASPNDSETVFLAKLLALMAAASCFISSSTTVNGKDTLHDVAVGWVLGVQTWIGSLFMSATAKFDILQVQCLLMIARQALAVDGDVVWLSSGSLIHSATIMGMHRDPARFAKMKPFWAEMRRRLWATVLELDLQASIDVGVPPSIDPDHYDCQPPSNLDDADLTEDMTEAPVAKESSILTQCSFLTMLHRSFPLRVRVAKAVNSLRFTLGYDEALHLGEDLVRYMNEALVPFPTPAFGSVPSFSRSLMLFLMQRCLLILHRPFYLSISLSPKYSYSRKVCLESALEMLNQFDLPLTALPSSRTPCLGQVGGGMFRDECFHAAATLCVELSLQITESGSNSAPSTQGGSLNDIVRSQQDVLLRVLERTQNSLGSRISPKGNGCKIYVFLTMALAAVKARLNGQDPLKKIEQAAKRAVTICHNIIRGLPYEELQAQPESDWSDIGLSATHTPDFGSNSEFSFDPLSMLSNEPIDLSPLGFNNMFDTSYYRMPELWDPNFLSI